MASSKDWGESNFFVVSSIPTLNTDWLAYAFARMTFNMHHMHAGDLGGPKTVSDPCNRNDRCGEATEVLGTNLESSARAGNSLSGLIVHFWARLSLCSPGSFWTYSDLPATVSDWCCKTLTARSIFIEWIRLSSLLKKLKKKIQRLAR